MLLSKEEKVDDDEEEPLWAPADSSSRFGDFTLLSGMRLGSETDYSNTSWTGARGFTEEPSNALIDHGHGIECFELKERVLVWWWDRYWRAHVQAIQLKVRTITIRWNVIIAW